MGRATVRVRNGMVASSHELASFYGAKILSEGGNVVDAAIATSAMLCVTQNNLCGLGGDMFALIKFNGGKVLNLNGSGRASRNASIGFYKDEKKLRSIPTSGPLACPTVPGLVHAWGEMHEKFATIDLKKLLSPAINYAKSGFPITADYSSSIEKSEKTMAEFTEWSKIFLPNGIVPEPGYVLKQKDLGNTLEEIANEGPSAFYEGDLASKIATGIQAQGGLIDEVDLRNHTSTWSEPVKTNYRDIDVYETAPNSQAATVLLWLNMLEEYDIVKNFPIDSPELLEIMIDTCLLTLKERATAIADPEYHGLPENFQEKGFARKIKSSMKKFQGTRPTSEHSSDTTYFSVGDSSGDCVSMIQSNYMGFGSGLVPKGTGLVLHNRGSYFTLNPKHHNALLPGKRTFHTLCASLGLGESGETVFAIGSMGGDVQPQIHAQLMTKIIDYQMDPQLAIDSPRWIIPCTIYEVPDRIYFEPGFAALKNGEIKKFISARGLSLSKFDSLSSLTGHAQAITFDGLSLAGGADPRGDGSVVGF